jgi:hypothetical protein
VKYKLNDYEVSKSFIAMFILAIALLIISIFSRFDAGVIGGALVLVILGVSVEILEAIHNIKPAGVSNDK